jgi:prephenate dehydrogenase
MTRPTITIVGLGLIGTSIGLALRQEKQDEFDIIGHDKDYGRARQVRKRGAVNKLDWNLVGACEKADMVIIATPLEGVRETLELTAEHLKEGCVVVDTANLKGPVIQWAEAHLSEAVSFVGTDPIISSDGQGVEAATPDLFRNALWCVSPAPSAAPEAVKLVADMIHLLGAQPYFLDPVEHDGLIAGVEHLPFVLSAALLRMTFGASTWKELRKVTGGLYESTTLLPSTDAGYYRDLLFHNRDNVIRWLDLYVDELRSFRELVASRDAEALAETFDKAVDARILWLDQRKKGYPDQEKEETELATMSGFLGGLLGLGAWRRPSRKKKTNKQSGRG